MCLIRSNYIIFITFGNSIKYGGILSLQYCRLPACFHVKFLNILVHSFTAVKDFCKFKTTSTFPPPPLQIC